MKGICIVDADRDYSAALALRLGRDGWRAAVVDDGKSILDRIRKEPPPLIVVSVELPHTSGFSICNKIRKDAALKGVPMILISSEATPDVFEQHMKLSSRADGYFLKSGDLETLVARITELAGKPPKNGDGVEAAAAVEYKGEVDELMEEKVMEEARIDDGDEWKKQTDLDRHESKMAFMRESLKKREGEIERFKKILASKEEIHRSLESALAVKEKELAEARETGSRLDGELSSERKAKAGLEDEFGEHKRSYDSLVQLKEESERENAEHIAERDRMLESVHDLLAQTTQSKEALEAETSATIADLNSRISDLESQIALTIELKEQVETSTAVAIEGLNGKINELEGDLVAAGEANRKLGEDKDSEIGSLNDRMASLNAELADTLSAKAAAESDAASKIAGLGGDIKALQSKLEAAGRERADFGRKTDEDISSLNDRIAGLNSELAESLEKASALHGEHLHLQDRHKAAQEERAAFGKESETRIGSLTDRVAALLGDLGSLKAAKALAESEAADRLSLLQGEHLLLEEKHRVANEERAAFGKESESRIRSLEDKAASLRADLGDLKEAKEQAEADAADRISALQGDNLSLEENLRAAHAKHQDYTSSAESKISGLDNRISQLNVELAETLSAKLQAENDAAARASEFESKIAELQSDLMTAAEEKETLEKEKSARISDLEDRLSGVMAELSDARRDLDENRDELSRTKRELGEHKKSHEEHKKGAEARIADLEKVAGERGLLSDSLKGMLDDLQKQNAQWEVRFEAAVSERKKAAAAADETVRSLKRDHLADMKKTHDTHGSETEELRQQFARKEDELRDAEEQNEFMNSQLAREIEKGKKLKEDYETKFGAMVSELKKRVAELEERDLDTSRRLREAERIAKEKEEEAAKAIKKAEADKKAKEQVQKSLDTAIRMLKTQQAPAQR